MNRSVRILTGNGVSLAAEVYCCDGASHNPGRVAIVNAAMGRGKEYYADFGRHLSSRGWHAIAYDYRGMGESKTGNGGDWPLTDWGRDAGAVAGWARAEFPGCKIIMIGHSIGGQIVGFLDDPDKVDAVIEVAAQKGYWRFWDGRRRYLMFGFWKTFPLLVPLFGRYPLMALVGGESLPRRIALDWYRWSRNAVFTASDGRSYDPLFERFTGPLLCMSFSDDCVYAPKKAVDCLASKFANARMTRWHLTPDDLGLDVIGHSGIFLDREIGGKLLDRVDRWLAGVFDDDRRTQVSPRIPDCVPEPENQPIGQ